MKDFEKEAEEIVNEIGEGMWSDEIPIIASALRRAFSKGRKAGLHHAITVVEGRGPQAAMTNLRIAIGELEGRYGPERQRAAQETTQEDGGE